MTIEILRGVYDRSGQWLVCSDDSDREQWCASRLEAMAIAAEWAAANGERVLILTDAE